MRIETEVKLDFKDVLIRPKRSTLSTRSNVDVTREFRFRHAGVEYHGAPIVAANMDTIGTFEMARALEPYGLSTALHKHYRVDECVAFFRALERKSSAFYSMGIARSDDEKFHKVMGEAGADADFHRLRRAYQSMRVEDFEDFVELFVGAGGKIDTRGPEGRTLLEGAAGRSFEVSP